MKALIDGDILVYRIGFTTQEESGAIAIARFNTMANDILLETGADEYQMYLSDSTENGFRIRYYPNYKANRVLPKPRHYELLKEHAIRNWEAIISVGQEADDAMGIEQYIPFTKDYGVALNTTICTIDKDLKQIPGNHYNFVTKQFTFVEKYDGLKWFYTQLLQGDTSENIKGVQGIGPKKAAKILDTLSTEEEMFLAVVEAYREWLKDEWTGVWDDFLEHQMLNLILINGICLKIRIKEDEIWTFPPNTIQPPQLMDAVS